MLEELIVSSGHMIIFYPKFCELTFFESFWGASKRFTRGNCNYYWAGLKAMVLKALKSVTLDEIRHHYQREQRFMDVYRKGLSGKAAECAAKKYRSHRRVPKLHPDGHKVPYSMILDMHYRPKMLRSLIR